MPISALPENTVRALGSTLVLYDAKSVVKELVDNALDAGASAISIEISANALDVIQVRDNGSGIGVEDRQLMCRRGCTSKIRSIEDLGKLGGSLLGFRGEALASLTDMSESVTVTTRVDGEIVANVIKYGASGMLSSASASHPVGTTVRVQDFLKRVPVRRQTVLKDASKVLMATRELMFCFAFARPRVRFSLKVLKGKGDKINWTYAPTVSGRLMEVATKITGKESACQCEEHAIQSEDSDLSDEPGWHVQALLQSGRSTSGNAPQYVSIDSRPVTTERGTVREISKLYKRYLRSSLSETGHASPSRPFLYMQIQCPPESYDVNIEPTKDQVLFLQPEKVLLLVETLFRRVYGDLKPNPQKHNDRQSMANPVEDTSFDLLLARKPAAGDTGTSTSGAWSPSVSDRTSELVAPSPQMAAKCHIDTKPSNHSAAQSQKIYHSMYTSDAEVLMEELAHGNLDTPNEKTDEPPDGEMLSRQSNARNPFTIAAMNRTVGPIKVEHELNSSKMPSVNQICTEQEEGSAIHLAAQSQHRTPIRVSTSLSSCPRSLPSPTGYQNPGPPLQRRDKSNHQAEEPGSISPDSDAEISNSHGHSLLTSWLTPRANAVPPPSNIAPSLTIPTQQTPSDHIGLPTPSSLSRKSTHRQSQKAFKPLTLRKPLDSRIPQRPQRLPHEQCSAETLSALLASPRMSGALPASPDEQVGMGTQGAENDGPGTHRAEPKSTPNPELEEIMDFEHRKKALLALQRKLTRGGQAPGRTWVQPKQVAEVEKHCSTIPHSFSSSDINNNDEAEDYASRFRTPEPGSQGMRSNPHHNRYLSALRNLHSSHAHPRLTQNSLQSQDSAPDLSQPAPMAEDDPRAYLIKSRRRATPSAPQRTKSSRLPLEMIPQGQEIHACGMVVQHPARLRHVHSLNNLAVIDEYLRRGVNAFTTFSEGALDDGVTSAVQEIVTRNYRCRDESGTEIQPNVHIEASPFV